MSRMYIPELGDVIIVSKTWAFDLYHENRNETLFALYGLEVKYPHYHEPKQPPTRVTIDAGEKLKIDRIYIRKGASDFSSISFFLVGKKASLPATRWSAIKTRSVRFWAKLADVNRIEFEPYVEPAPKQGKLL